MPVVSFLRCAQAVRVEWGGEVSVRGFRILVCCCVVLAVAGCTRTHYRLRADREAAALLAEKTTGMPWGLPYDFTVEPHPESRFYDPTPTVDPLLPVPAPRRYDYALPEMPQRDPRRFRGVPPAAEDASPNPDATMLSSEDEPSPNAGPTGQVVRTSVTIVDSQPLVEPTRKPTSARSPSRPRIVRLRTGDGKLAISDEPDLCDAKSHDQDAPSQRQELQGELASVSASQGLVRVVSYQQKPAAIDIEDNGTAGQRSPAEEDEGNEELRIVPIPEEIWQSLPRGCLIRMFEFESVREEYRRTFGQDPGADQRDQSPRLALEDIVEQALINSREYQAEKEGLYKAALTLSLERFDFDLKYTLAGNPDMVDYLHQRDAGITTDALKVKPKTSSDALLATGGTFATSIANDIVLHFNGADGFTPDIGSKFVLDISQKFLQWDIAFDDLTDAERNVVYKAREFLRYRKELFASLARNYYDDLLLSYRGIEIAAQDYFSNLRGFQQGQAEYRAGRLPRFQVDQFEQDSLESRRDLINRCNTLEGNLDALKLAIGLPPELPINLDLNELEELTLRDEATASAERVRRAQLNLLTERRQPTPERGALVTPAIDLAQRMLILAEIRGRLGKESPNVESLELLRDQLLVDEAELVVRFNRRVLLEENQAAQEAPDLAVFRRTMDLVDSVLFLISRHLVLAERLGTAPDTINEIRNYAGDLRDTHEHLSTEQPTAVNEHQMDRLRQLVEEATALLVDTDALAGRSIALLNTPQLAPDQELQETLEQVDGLVAESQEMLDDEVGGLVPVEIDLDDAMLTALTLRFDLLNQRGSLADEWRDIKFAGDDLRSVLNLKATQTIETRDDVNRPFDFTFNESTTQLKLEFDAPFNRKQQRNAFRQSLIDYNAALRNLIEAEDNIKKAIRDDLRKLRVDREQYRIAVASAALAYERIVSTRRQLRLGVQNITARDVLESQRAYTGSLNALARAHISYILSRIKLFQDLELLEVDETGFWPMLYDEQFQPEPNHQLHNYGRPIYGELPRRGWHSHKMKRMLNVPAGNTMIFDPHNTRRQPLEEIPAPEPD